MFPGFRFTYLFRKASTGHKYSIIRIFFSLLRKRYSYKYGFQIPLKTQIGEGFYIGHFGTLVINKNAKIGKNCNVSHNVTIGQANRGKLEGYPVIGDNVWIGTGAVIVGKVNIGSNVLIGPNSFVNIDVPDHSIVLGNPCKISARENPCEGYINFVLEG
jgi:serine O-acetyltransferase